MNSTTPPPADTWMGWSNGKWDGDTLVIDSTGFMGGTVGALDRGGHDPRQVPRSCGQLSHRRPARRRTDPTHGPDHLSYQATIEDPNVYTRPWTISMPLYRRVEPNMQLGEFKCEEFVGDLVLRQVPEEISDAQLQLHRERLVALHRWRVSARRFGRSRQAKSTYKVPRTPDGQPDLQGYWTNLTYTPFERPKELANKAVLHREGSDRGVQQGGRRLAEPGRPLREHRLRARRRCRQARSRTSARRS